MGRRIRRRKNAHLDVPSRVQLTLHALLDRGRLHKDADVLIQGPSHIPEGRSQGADLVALAHGQFPRQGEKWRFSGIADRSGLGQVDAGQGLGLARQGAQWLDEPGCDQKHAQYAQDRRAQSEGDHATQQDPGRSLHLVPGHGGHDVPVQGLEMGDAVDTGPGSRPLIRKIHEPLVPGLIQGLAGDEPLLAPLGIALEGKNPSVARNQGQKAVLVQLQGIELLLGALGDLLFRGRRLLLHVRKLHGQGDDGFALGNGEKIDQQRTGNAVQHSRQIPIQTEDREHAVGGQLVVAEHGDEGTALEVRSFRIHGQFADQGAAENARPRRLEQVEMQAEVQQGPGPAADDPLSGAHGHVLHAQPRGPGQDGHLPKLVLALHHAQDVAGQEAEVTGADIVLDQNHRVAEGFPLAPQAHVVEFAKGQQDDGHRRQGDGRHNQGKEFGAQGQGHDYSAIPSRRSFLRRPSRVMPSSSAALVLLPAQRDKASETNLPSTSCRLRSAALT